MATYTIRNNTTQDWRDTAMSKAQFEALASERRTNRAGSGFDSFGANIVADNLQGIKALSTNVNSFFMGSDTVGSTGNIKECINGVIHKHYDGLSSYKDQIVHLPPAPTVLPSTATLTTEQTASGVIKHADASNSGLIVNGKFDTDTSGWSAYESGGSISVVSGKGRAINVVGNAGYSQSFTTVIGKSYTIEFEFYKGTTTAGFSARVGTAFQGNQNGSWAFPNVDRRYSVSFTATATTTYFGARTDSTTAGQYIEFDNIAVFPADAISRSDLVFLESWHEDVSEKDFVYPLGNVQYLGTTGDAGTPVAGAFAGSATYSLFSDTWQADSALVGKGYVWSTLSDANKKDFVANPENNCYLDGDKVIQVRYRMRVVMGLGDSWANVEPQNNTYMYASSGNFIKAKGKNIASASDFSPSYSSSTPLYQSAVNSIQLPYGSGIFTAVDSNTVLATTTSYSGTTTHALPIALVHRRNQGAYHPVYNANGTSKVVNQAGTGSAFWYESPSNTFNDDFDSIAKAFTLAASGGQLSTQTTWGSIAGGAIGRPDLLAYDQIHEGDILDLRNSSQKVEDYNRLIDREFNKLVAGTYRGSEGEWVTKKTAYVTRIFYSYDANIIGLWDNDNIGALLNYGDSVSAYCFVGTTSYYFRGIVSFKGPTSIQIKTVSPHGITIGGYGTSSDYSLISVKSTRTKSNTLTHTDIIGSPANYPTAWKQAGVSGVPLIVAEDGTSMLPTGALTTFKLSRKANATPLQVLKSTDSGATWTALTVTTHYTFNTITNAITFVTAPATTDLIMVTYQTHTNMAVATVNSEVLAIGDVVSINAYESQHGVNIASNMIMKVPVWYGVNRGVKFTWYETIANAFWANSARYPIHSALSFNQFGSSNPAVKTFPYLTRSNGKAYLNLVFKEMKYNGTSWGDDSKFNIVDNVSTTTDDNGATVLIGQKRVELPYFIGQGE